MARYWCERCGEESNTLSELHLCKDVKRRLERRERQRDAVLNILAEEGGIRSNALLVDVAERIVTVLARMGVAED